MEELYQGKYTGERALYGSRELRIKNGVFTDGESPLKESSDIELECCLFGWKYPLWYSHGISLKNCRFTEDARAGLWYTDDISVTDTAYDAPKGFRRCNGLTLENVTIPNALETLWKCRSVRMKNVTAAGDYLAMDCDGMEIEGLTLDGNYAFDGAKNITIRDSRLITKDAFWNSENITAVNCFIEGEYLAWNSKNLTLINCTVKSLQGLCFVENLVMKNCRTEDTTLAFEYSTIDAEITGGIDSVKNPSGGTLTADSIGELIMENDRVDVSATKININIRENVK